MRKACVFALLLMITLTGRTPGFAAWQGAAAALPMFGYTIVHAYPHDRDAFTQGLQVVDGVFYEGTGLNGKSSIRKVKIDSGEVLQKRDVPAQYFGEGITVRGNHPAQESERARVRQGRGVRQRVADRLRGEN